MADPRLIKLAELLVNYSVEIKPGDWVMVRGDVAAEPLVAEVVRQVVRAGGKPTVLLSSDAIEEAFLREANPEVLEWVSPVNEMLYEQADVLMALRATSNTRALTGIDPQKERIRAVANRGLTETYMRRSAAKELRWVGTQYPCSAYAQEADMSLSEYEDFVYAATFCDRDDPVAAWKQVHDEQQKIVDWLAGKKIVTVKSPNADLTLSIEGRNFINSDGKKNMPSGEVFTGPVEDSANGWVTFNYPAIRGGREVEGVRLEFKDGKVIRASAKKNEAYLLTQLDSDEGARYLGEFAIGTNYGITHFTKSILYDEKIGGSFHMAVGAGYPETGSVNKSSIHWDFICDIQTDSEIRVDGELLYKDGQFAI
ncbi:MAG: aminopeptidase [Anaerolineae bacterium]|nr:aminopeptidase [Anaerolineae bacterium]MBL6966765.1 aminopeptidase [Anaerolineales bacterium]